MVTTNTQRIEQLEQGIAEMRASLAEEVAKAVDSAVGALQQTLATQIATSLEKATKQLGDEMAKLHERGDRRFEDGERSRGAAREGPDLRDMGWGNVRRRRNRDRNHGEASEGEEEEVGFGGGFQGSEISGLKSWIYPYFREITPMGG